jgi:hypothetical protein
MTDRTPEQEARLNRLLDAIAHEDELREAGKVQRLVLIDGKPEFVIDDAPDGPDGRTPLSYREAMRPDGTWELVPCRGRLHRGRVRLGYD